MYRSSSSARVSDEFFPHSSLSPAFSSPILKLTSSVDTDELPILNPQSHVAKKEKYRIRSAENAIHLIPLILVLSAIILWIFSNPVAMVNKDGSIVARVDNAVQS